MFRGSNLGMRNYHCHSWWLEKSAAFVRCGDDESRQNKPPMMPLEGAVNKS